MLSFKNHLIEIKFQTIFGTVSIDKKRKTGVSTDMTNHSMISAIDNLLPGRSLVYYSCETTSLSNCPDKDLRNHAYKCHERDTHELTQRRVKTVGGHGFFEYIITRKRNPPDPQKIHTREIYRKFLDSSTSGIKHGEYVKGRR